MSVDYLVDLAAGLSNLPERHLSLWSRKLPQKVSPSTPPRRNRPNHRLNDEELQSLIAAYEAGSSVSRLTTRFGINRTTVLDHLARAGIPRRANLRKLTDQQVEWASQLYQQGGSLKTVGSRFGVNASTLRKELTAADIPVRPRRGWEHR